MCWQLKHRLWLYSFSGECKRFFFFLFFFFFQLLVCQDLKYLKIDTINLSIYPTFYLVRFDIKSFHSGWREHKSRHVWLLQKILEPFDISILGCLRRQAIVSLAKLVLPRVCMTLWNQANIVFSPTRRRLLLRPNFEWFDEMSTSNYKSLKHSLIWYLMSSREDYFVNGKLVSF